VLYNHNPATAATTALAETIATLVTPYHRRRRDPDLQEVLVLDLDCLSEELLLALVAALKAAPPRRRPGKPRPKDLKAIVQRYRAEHGDDAALALLIPDDLGAGNAGIETATALGD
jgi:hypothetical protein